MSMRNKSDVPAVGHPSGYTPSPSATHLRNRSSISSPHHDILTSYSTSNEPSPFADEHAAFNPPAPRASLMSMPPQSPVQQHLYSSASLRGSATSGPPLTGFGTRYHSFASSQTSIKSPESTSRFDIGYSELLYASDDDDDFIHNVGDLKLKTEGPDRRIIEPHSFKAGQGIMSGTGFLNLSGVIFLMGAIVFLFGGLPILTASKEWNVKAYVPSGAVNYTGTLAEVPSYRGLIDPDTPDSAKTMPSFLDDDVELQLVFSDEFNTDGREFYPGMDPYFEAVSLHYWPTDNLEWYDPGNVYTEGGNLVIELTKETNSSATHGFDYFGGMLQSWNAACFQGGYIEVKVSFPGNTNISGFWPAIWSMSNLGRAGYGGSLDGAWPYVYDSCDVGTLANQSNPLTGLPTFTSEEGDVENNNGDLSHLVGQQYSRCTCGSNAVHPGPQYANGTWKGRGASEIDLFEATVDEASGTGSISQSMQWAPMTPYYAVIDNTTNQIWFNTTDGLGTGRNEYVGGATQQVTSGLSTADPKFYNSTTTMVTVGAEWIPSTRNGWGTGKAAWTYNGFKTWNISDTAMPANAEAEISNRVITDEPMYLIFNVGASWNFGKVDVDNLIFPGVMRVDYVRVYQDPEHIMTTCNPADAPTTDFINDNLELYQNPNLTTIADAGRTYNQNSIIDECT